MTDLLGSVLLQLRTSTIVNNRKMNLVDSIRPSSDSLMCFIVLSFSFILSHLAKL